ncbi:MvdC/MvdD family ATP grasp protein [Anaeromyxobacter diazotrophicus]|uniref:ATP-grasp ribosomal peptide maturase n=1 Tax=Anaeromyxobacter diazotrophicus TaxID=2590199 RepID=A0A7I9VU59_9BACT|nr:alpha-L-glutamate ligase [Anaeromyxobacter diazotrophicus]GEJ59497.1 ATP-grasp ribosomal peptide maturase [Anaeromyxobacter diazotrophicus]
MSRRRGTVLVVAPAADSHARAVLAELRRRRVPATSFDTARFPERATLALHLDAGSSWRGALRSGDALDPERVRAVWWRRPEPYRLHPSLRGRRRDGAFCAADDALGAFWSALDARWVNDPARDEAAEHKPRQLALAARLALAIPETLVTNDPAAARAFVAARPDGATIHKNVTGAPALLRHTALARQGDRALFASVRHLPLMIQERVPGTDLRVTVVGDDLFAAEIDVEADPVDVRAALPRARMRPVPLPPAVASKLQRFVRALGLTYAALDLRRREDGEHVFLEVNPSGEWLYVERRTGQPVTAAVATLLARVARRTSPQ